MTDANGTDGDYAVLIVEGDPLVRCNAADVAIEAGFRALEAKNADEAIRLLEEDESIRILFTTIDMTGSMDGFALARTVRDRWPPVHIIAVSERRSLKKADLPAHSEIFSKPYDCFEVKKALIRYREQIEA